MQQNCLQCKQLLMRQASWAEHTSERGPALHAFVSFRGRALAERVQEQVSMLGACLQACSTARTPV